MTALGSLPITQKDSSSTPFGMMLNPASRFALLLDWRAVKLTAVTGSNGSKAGFHFVEKHCQNSSGFGGTGLAGHLQWIRKSTVSVRQLPFAVKILRHEPTFSHPRQNLQNRGAPVAWCRALLGVWRACAASRRHVGAYSAAQ